MWEIKPSPEEISSGEVFVFERKILLIMYNSFSKNLCLSSIFIPFSSNTMSLPILKTCSKSYREKSILMLE